MEKILYKPIDLGISCPSIKVVKNQKDYNNLCMLGWEEISEQEVIEMNEEEKLESARNPKRFAFHYKQGIIQIN